MTYLIYKLTCNASGKSYVGVTGRTLDARWWQHCNDALNRRYRTAMGAAIRKYGTDCWEKQILRTADDWPTAARLESLEIANQNTFRPAGYNLTTGGEGTPGATRSPEVIAKVADFHRGRKRPAETGKRISAQKKGKPAPPGVIENLRLVNTGRERTSAEKRNISEALKGHEVSETTRAKIAIKATGRRHNTKTIATIKAKTTGANSKLAIEFIAVFPDGREEHVTGLNDFCRRNNICTSAVGKALKNPKSRVKGIGFRAIGDTTPLQPVFKRNFRVSELLYIWREMFHRRKGDVHKLKEIASNIGCSADYLYSVYKKLQRCGVNLIREDIAY